MSKSRFKYIADIEVKTDKHFKITLINVGQTNQWGLAKNNKEQPMKLSKLGNNPSRTDARIAKSTTCSCQSLFFFVSVGMKDDVATVLN